MKKPMPISIEFIYQVFALILTIIVVHAGYVGIVRPKADEILARQATLVAEYSFTSDEDPFASRRDHFGRASLYYVNPRGLFFQIHEEYLSQHAYLGTEPFRANVFTTGLAIAYELPKKFGLLSLEVRNLFDRKYQFLVDPFALDPRIPRRQFIFSLGFNF